MFEVAYDTLTPPTRTIKKTYMDQVESRTTHPRSLEDRRAASRQSDRVAFPKQLRVHVPCHVRRKACR